MRMELTAAIDIIRSHAPAVAVEVVPVQDASLRIAATDVHAPGDFPPFARSRMDGYAVNRSEADFDRGFRVVGNLAAADRHGAPLVGNDCVRLATGSAVPPGADCVIPEEYARLDGDTMFVEGDAWDKAFIEEQGAVRMAGDRLIQAGAVIDHRDIELASALRLNSLPVRVAPTVGIVSTGGELTERFSSKKGILNSNAYMLRALSDEMGLPHRYLGLVPDDRPRLVEMLVRAARDVDIVVSFGGTSVGRADLMRDAIVEAGGEVLVSGIEASPGKTFTFAILFGTPILVMPGTPAAAAACAELFLPAIVRASLVPETGFAPVVAEAGFSLKRKPGYAKLIGCRLAIERGRAVCLDRHAPPSPGYSVRGVAVLPPELDAVTPGTLVNVYVMRHG